MGLQRLVLIASGVVLTAHPARAQDEFTIYSARADSVSVTIYPDDLALITETRTIELPAEPATLVIQDVADTLLPQSAVIRELDRPLAESNFDFNRLSPDSLLAHSIGQTVTLIRMNPSSGVVTRVPATVLAAGDRVLLETATGTEALNCSGLPEGIAFLSIPEDLVLNPQLSIRLAAGDPGEQTIRVSYLASGFEWASDYVAHLDEALESMELTGWATVRNSSNRSFSQAELQLVAGKLNVLPADDRGSGGLRYPPIANPAGGEEIAPLRLGDCFGSPVPDLQRRDEETSQFETVIVTGTRIRREEFGDYHLYRLPWRTDLGARQTKQVKFLDQDQIRVERLYRMDTYGDDFPRSYPTLELIDDREDGLYVFVTPPAVVIRTENTAEAGLGEPLPEGSVRVFEQHDGEALLAGQTYIADRPVGAPVDLEIASALDAVVESSFEVNDDNFNDVVRLSARYRVINDKEVPIDIVIRHRIETFEVSYAIEETSDPYATEDGFFVWRLPVPPGSATLGYTLRATFDR